MPPLTASPVSRCNSCVRGEAPYGRAEDPTSLRPLDMVVFGDILLRYEAHDAKADSILRPNTNNMEKDLPVAEGIHSRLVG